MAEEIKIELIAEVKKAASSMNEVALQVEQLNENIETFGDKSKEETKKSSKGFAALKKSVQVVGGAVKGLLVGGLALLVAGFATLVEGLRNNQEVMDAVSVVMKTIQGVAAQAAQVFVDMFKAVSDATGGFDAMQKVLGGALTISLNVFVGMIQGLVLNFKKAQLAWEESFLGGNDPETIKRLNEEIQTVGDKLDKTGENISNAGKQIKDNFGEAVGEVGQLTKGVADATQKSLDTIDVTAANSRAKRIVQLQNDAKLAIAENDKLQFKYQRDAELQRQIRDDVSKSLAERTEANDQLLVVLGEQEKLQKANAQTQVDLATEILAADSKNIDKKVALIEAEKVYADVLENITGFISEQDVNRVGLLVEETDLINSRTEAENIRAISQKEFAAELKLDNLERINALILAAEEEDRIERKRLQSKILLYKEGTQARSDAEQAFEDFKVASDQKIRLLDAEKLAEEKVIAEARMEMQFALASAIGGAIGAIGNLFAEGTAASKAAGLAEIAIGTGVGLIQGLDIAQKSAKGTGPAAAFAFPIFYATQIAAVLGAVSQAKSILGTVKGGGGSTGSVSGARGAIASSPPAFNVVGANPQSQLAETISGQTQEPVKAYVTASDVSTAQSLERNIIESASIG
jgi:hypothetical protein